MRPFNTCLPCQSHDVHSSCRVWLRLTYPALSTTAPAPVATSPPCRTTSPHSRSCALSLRLRCAGCWPAPTPAAPSMTPRCTPPSRRCGATCATSPSTGTTQQSCRCGSAVVEQGAAEPRQRSVGLEAVCSALGECNAGSRRGKYDIHHTHQLICPQCAQLRQAERTTALPVTEPALPATSLAAPPRWSGCRQSNCVLLGLGFVCIMGY